MEDSASPTGERLDHAGRTFLPVYVDALQIDTVTEFDLFLFPPSGQAPVLYRERNLPFTEPARRRLADSRVERLYVPSEDAATCEQYVEDNLSLILNNDEINIHQRSEILYASAKTLLKRIFEDPDLPATVKRSKQLVENTIEFVFAEPTAFENLLQVTSFDYYTYTHSVNVFVYCVTLAQRLGYMNRPELYQFGLGALLHDIGKSKLDRAMITAKRKLTDEEWGMMRQHPVFGCKMLLEREGVGDTALDVVRHHHEKLNGTGYPDRLRDGRISEFARIAAIGDIFDALTTRRPYKEALGSFPALQLMKKEMADELDPKFFSAFVAMMGNPTPSPAGKPS